MSPNTLPPVARRRAVYLHSLLCTPTTPTLSLSPVGPDPSPYKYRLLPSQVIIHNHPPVKMEPTECSETSTFNIQTPGKCPEESLPYLQHGKSLKTTNFIIVFQLCNTMRCSLKKVLYILSVDSLLKKWVWFLKLIVWTWNFVTLYHLDYAEVR
jgi:hypothetical protein